MIDRSTVDRIVDTAEIVDVISDFISLKKRGVNYLGLCPFHNEKTPSFTVSPSKGIYKCFGCGKAGNAVNFVMEHEKLSYPEALKYLARKYHIEIVETEQTEEEKERRTDRDALMVLNSYAQRQFSEYLNQNESGISIGLGYFRERGIRDDMIKKFQLGYSPETRDFFSTRAIKDGYKVEYLLKSGLSVERNDKYYDRFSGRIIFPIHGISGQVIGFGGRILRNDAKTAKYLNSPESDIYHKSKSLYGIFFAKKEILRQDLCYLVEGYTDVISMHQAGIENVVASSGTSLTIEQIRLIKRFSKNVTVIYDGDSAGVKASLRGIDLILEEGLNVKIVALPEGEDPDSYSRKMNATAFMEFIRENQEDFIKFKTKTLLKETEDDPMKKAGLITNIVQTIAVIPSGITRSVYIKECSRLLDVSEQILYNEALKIRRKRHNSKHKVYQRDDKREKAGNAEKQEIVVKAKQDPSEKEIIRALLHFGNELIFSIEGENGKKHDVRVKEYVVSELMQDNLKFINEDYQLIYSEVIKHLEEDDFDIEKYFVNFPDPKISNCAVDLLSQTYNISKIHKKAGAYVRLEKDVLQTIVPQYIIAFKTSKVMMMLKEVDDKIKEVSGTNDFDRLRELMEEKMQLEQLKMQLAKKLGDRTFI